MDVRKSCFIAALCCIIFYLLITHCRTLVRPSSRTVYCIMITGKSATRARFAVLAIDNFMQQTYDDRKLLIINHGEPVINKASHGQGPVVERIVTKGNQTLGHLRNIALSMVPDGAMWCPWDDDDHRSPTFITTLVINKVKVAVMLRNRIEYSLDNDVCWAASFRSGWIVTVLCDKRRDLVYADLDTLEDVPLKIRLNAMNVSVIDNEPLLYIRSRHGDNTSPYVDMAQTSANVSNTIADVSEYPIGEVRMTEVLRRMLPYKA
jgi:hypothetical protein